MATRNKSTKQAAYELDQVPQTGDRVTIGNGKSVWTIYSISHSGKEVNVHIPNTNLERFRVPIEDLNYVGLVPRKPKEPPKPKIDIEAIREHLDTANHTIVDLVQGEIAVLTKYLHSQGITETEPLEDFMMNVEARLKKAIEVISIRLG